METEDVVRVQDLLRDLGEMLMDSRPPTANGLAAGLARWREEMERISPSVLPALPPAERQDLLRRAREAQLRVEDCRRLWDKARRAHLVRLLACRAAQDTLASYRRRAAPGFFSRTV